jgi:hypothetical protein
MRDTLSPKTSLQVNIPLLCGISAAMMLDQGFSIHHEAREGHEEWKTGLEKRPNFNMFFLCLRALCVLRGGLLQINYQLQARPYRHGVVIFPRSMNNPG